MRALASDLAVAFALANLYLLYLTGPLVSPQHQLIFHLPGSAAVLFVPVLVDLLALTVLFTLALILAARHPRAELLFWAALLLPLPTVLVATAASFADHPAHWLPRLLGSLSLLSAALFCCTAVHLDALLPRFGRCKPVLVAVLALLSLSGLSILGQLLWNGCETRHLNPPFVARRGLPAAPSAPGPRIVWVILDELSYRQIFLNRPPGLPLPNLHRLASASTVLTQAVAAAESTRIAVPSLLTGLPLSATDPASDGRHLLLRPRGTHAWQLLDPNDTVFADVAAAGLPTGIAGWYEPYCRLLPAVLGRCFWTYSDDLPAGLNPNASIESNALGPLRTIAGQGLRLWTRFTGDSSVDPDGQLDVTRHEADYRALYTAGDRLLSEQNTGLVLLHMPIPHPWGFYDRRTGRFPGHRTSYLDNLVLADLYLGHLRSLLERDGSWNRTTLIVMGDHGWRTAAVWRPSGFWTAEEEQASQGGALQDRPAVLIKLPGQQTPGCIDTPFAAYRTRAMIDAIVAGKIASSEDLQQWIRHP